MLSARIRFWLGTLACLVVLTACLEQFDPTANNAKFHKEHDQSLVVAPKLTATGDLPPAGGPAIDINERFQTLCSNCHGQTGHGDGPGGMALNPRPRNFTDAAWQAATNDERIAKVITNGGASVGLSAMMAPWGSVLSPEEVKLMVGKVRTFK